MKQIPVIAFAIAALGAAAGSRAATIHVQADHHRDAYSLKLHGQMTCMNLSVSDINSLHAGHGDSLWLRRHGKAYLVRDRERLAQVEQLFAPVRAMEPEQREIERKSSAIDRREEALDRERDQITDRDEDEDNGLDEAAETRLRDLDRELRGVQAEQRDIEREERDIDRRSEALERAAESELWKLADRWIADGSAAPDQEP